MAATASALKILVIGPCRAGKSAISNFLSDRAELPSPEYLPTAGCRYMCPGILFTTCVLNI
jgi:hypothetical protein